MGIMRGRPKGEQEEGGNATDSQISGHHEEKNESGKERENS